VAFLSRRKAEAYEANVKAQTFVRGAAHTLVAAEEVDRRLQFTPTVVACVALPAIGACFRFPSLCASCARKADCNESAVRLIRGRQNRMCLIPSKSTTIKSTPLSHWVSVARGVQGTPSSLIKYPWYRGEIRQVIADLLDVQIFRKGHQSGQCVYDAVYEPAGPDMRQSAETLGPEPIDPRRKGTTVQEVRHSVTRGMEISCTRYTNFLQPAAMLIAGRR